VKTCHDSWKVDQTSLKVKNVCVSLSQAVDSKGNTLQLLLSLTRDGQAPKRFLKKALHATASSAPQAHLAQA
jgi:transposase-like protein